MKFNLTRLGKYPAAGRMTIFVLTLLALWVPVAAPVYMLVSDPNWVSILSMAMLYGEFIFLVRFWGQNVYGQAQILRRYGLETTRQNGVDLLRGLGTGLLSLLSLLLLEGFLGWLAWQVPVLEVLPRVILEGFLVALGVGFAEELLFRGWLLDELQRDYSPGASLWADATIFALLHFIKPLDIMLRKLPEFPGLLLLGLTLVWAKRTRSGRLGLPMGFHAGLVWGYYIINTGELVRYPGTVPDWITGLDKHPLAGVAGMLFLAAIALGMNRAARLQQSVVRSTINN